RQNSKLFRQYYEQHEKKFLTNHIHILLKDFVSRMMAKLNYDSEMRASILNKRIFNNELTEWMRGMFLNYMDEFSVMAIN
ncbi:MAG: hypothetical protein ACRD9R_12740, partial [Pyrinomonadaceae bacterium]